MRLLLLSDCTYDCLSVVQHYLIEHYHSLGCCYWSHMCQMLQIRLGPVDDHIDQGLGYCHNLQLCLLDYYGCRDHCPRSGPTCSLLFRDVSSFHLLVESHTVASVRTIVV